MRKAVRQCREILQVRQADVLVGFGGFVALPAYLAARGRVPIVVHEANAKAGLANKVGRRFTPFVAEATSESLPGAVRIGIPLRESIANLTERHGAGRPVLGGIWIRSGPACWYSVGRRSPVP